MHLHAKHAPRLLLPSRLHANSCADCALLYPALLPPPLLQAEHAPEYLTLKPYGSCGTPAVWVDRRCNANALMARLKEAAASRRAFTETASRRAAVEAAA